MKALFTVNKVTRYGGVEELAMSAVTSSDAMDDPEAMEFWDATPGGKLEITISNPALHGHFNPGDDCYLTFEKREKSAE